MSRSYLIITVSAGEVLNFNARWPGSRLDVQDYTFEFAPNGDLVDIQSADDYQDGPEILALSEDAQAGLCGCVEHSADDVYDNMDDPMYTPDEHGAPDSVWFGYE